MKITATEEALLRVVIVQHMLTKEQAAMTVERAEADIKTYRNMFQHINEDSSKWDELSGFLRQAEKLRDNAKQTVSELREAREVLRHELVANGLDGPFSEFMLCDCK